MQLPIRKFEMNFKNICLQFCQIRETDYKLNPPKSLDRHGVFKIDKSIPQEFTVIEKLWTNVFVFDTKIKKPHFYLLLLQNIPFKSSLYHGKTYTDPLSTLLFYWYLLKETKIECTNVYFCRLYNNWLIDFQLPCFITLHTFIHRRVKKR